MSLGKRILSLRLQSSLTQRELADRAGLAVSYLSRVENDHLTPSIPTLSKITEALGEPMGRLFEQDSVLESGDVCPVSASGRCVLDHMLVGKGRKPKSHWEGYTPQQLEIIRLCDFLVHSGDRRILISLSTLLRSLFSLIASKKRKGELAPAGSIPAPPDTGQVT